MTKLSSIQISNRRAGALALVALLILIPAVWIAWSISAADAAADTLRTQSDLLVKLRERVATLGPGDLADASGDAAASVFIPGETPAIAGAALQRIVADAVKAAGGRVIETEFARVEATEEDPGRVDLRVSFDADILSLQRILHQLETGMPILLVRSIDVQTSTEATEEASPPLRVLMLVGGYWEVTA
jgi:hypothetical protein